MKKKRRYRHSLAMLVVFTLTFCVSCTAAPDPEAYRFDSPSSYYFYRPEGDDPDQARPLFIGVHGSSTEGRSCWDTWQPQADDHGYALLCPVLADPDGRLHQLHGNERLYNIVYRLYQEYPLQPIIFLVGFSGGARFVQGYAFMNPAYVSGVSVIAGADYYPPSQATGQVRFAVIVGDRDNPLTAQDAWSLDALLRESGYQVGLHVLPGVGHEITPEAVEITLELYDQANKGR